MPIVSSEVVINHAEEDEYHRRIRELHTDHTGVVTPVNYKAVFNEAGNIIDEDGTILFNTLADKTAANAVKVEKSLVNNESEEMSETDNEIIAGDYADIRVVALRYLRKAYLIEDSYAAYKKFDRFNSYRVSQGWTVNQVVSNLATVGLTQNEWDTILTRYVYLSNATRVEVMQNYQIILNNDPRD